MRVGLDANWCAGVHAGMVCFFAGLEAGAPGRLAHHYAS